LSTSAEHPSVAIKAPNIDVNIRYIKLPAVPQLRAA